MGLINSRAEDTTFASVLADGKIHVSVPEGTEGAVIREYETSDGKKGTKTEFVFTELIGKIQRIDFREGEYGKQLLVVVADEGDEKPITLALSTESNFGEDLMKKLPGVDLKKMVKLAPFSFADDKGKKRRGITVMQDGDKKLTDYFYDKENEKKLHGYPEVPKPSVKGKPISKAQWKIYFAQAREFLVEFTTEHFKVGEVALENGGALADEFPSKGLKGKKK